MRRVFHRCSRAQGFSWRLQAKSGNTPGQIRRPSVENGTNLVLHFKICERCCALESLRIDLSRDVVRSWLFNDRRGMQMLSQGRILDIRSVPGNELVRLQMRFIRRTPMITLAVLQELGHSRKESVAVWRMCTDDKRSIRGVGQRPNVVIAMGSCSLGVCRPQGASHQRIMGHHGRFEQIKPSEQRVKSAAASRRMRVRGFPLRYKVTR